MLIDWHCANARVVRRMMGMSEMETMGNLEEGYDDSRSHEVDW